MSVLFALFVACSAIMMPAAVYFQNGQAIKKSLTFPLIALIFSISHTLFLLATRTFITMTYASSVCGEVKKQLVSLEAQAVTELPDCLDKENAMEVSTLQGTYGSNTAGTAPGSSGVSTASTVPIKESATTSSGKEQKNFFLRVNSLSIKKGSFLAIAGSNGSGKSSLLQALMQRLTLLPGSNLRLSANHSRHFERQMLGNKHRRTECTLALTTWSFLRQTISTESKRD